MEQPLVYKAFRYLCWLQIALVGLLIAIAIATISFKATSGFWLGFQEQLVNQTPAKSLAAYRPYHAGYFTGRLLAGLIPTALALFFASKGKWVAVVVCFVLEVLLSFNLVALIGLGIVFLPDFKRYLAHLKASAID
ncbi:hypothetical protein ACN4EG_09095 [Alkalinema pantanalense CENA528]|uniref:hypothetical protein n=1 Tax=Alkalinema pantanalense TaxID=1620705 RepID=UPI003D6FE63F